MNPPSNPENSPLTPEAFSGQLVSSSSVSLPTPRSTALSASLAQPTTSFPVTRSTSQPKIEPDYQKTLPQQRSRHIPWLRLFASTPFWSILICHVSFNWTWYTLVTCLPLYLAQVLGFSTSEVSLAASPAFSIFPPQSICLINCQSFINLAKYAEYILSSL
ncbi:unnamed protein product [Protopolystoma xenopodis]|uniref:Major facilitator superfamily (MFS) profile domain-containing protein n=1 Tax=Protopolystoma xenopodis TaxID=117903 RepID=A0A448WLU9_9PLAT|nr:unnamed protein product [Protopolystoma xenopodis]